MTTLILRPDDPRLGTVPTETTARVWPKIDIAGNEYQKQTVTLRRLGSRFVVIPLRTDAHDLVIEMAARIEPAVDAGSMAVPAELVVDVSDMAAPTDEPTAKAKRR